uniref:FAM192A_Fyv6_N domain-containing protein n=1 Tax=Haemonchus contortus TaxID=6289 RepID=A0A7I4Y5F3_HAECO
QKSVKVMSDDIEKTQDGREDEAERFVKANAYIKAEAERRFRTVEKFLERETEEVEKMISSVENRHISAEKIYEYMEKCEQKRQAFAILSCDLPSHHQPPQNQLLQSLDGTSNEDVKTQESDTAINTSLMQKKDDMIKRMNRRGGYTKKFAGRRRTPYSTPQSSVIEETVTQPSEQTSLETLKVLKKAMETLREKRGTPETPLNDTKSRDSTKEATSRDKSQLVDDEKATPKKWRILKKKKKVKSAEDKLKTEVKKRWWQFW